jgi:hypothetical protein
MTTMALTAYPVTGHVVRSATERVKINNYLYSEMSFIRTICSAMQICKDNSG